MSETVVSEGSGKSSPVRENNSFGVPSGSENNHSSPFSQDAASQKHCQATNKIPDTNIDVNMLLKAMMNLSEIFRTYCFNKQASVPEHHSISIKRVISNLTASLVMLAVDSSSTMPSSKVDSLCKDLPDAQMVSSCHVLHSCFASDSLKPDKCHLLCFGTTSDPFDCIYFQ